MAGNYPDPPFNRMAWDRDGSQAYQLANDGLSVARALTSTEIRQLNNETPEGAVLFAGSAFYIVVLFPELRDLQAIMLAAVNNTSVIQTSADTTNGVDGTWTTITTTQAADNPVAYRTTIQTETATGVRAVRILNSAIAFSSGFYTLHLYGHPSTGQNLDRLEWWHPTLDQSLILTPAHLDWGNRPRSTTATKQIRLKNFSSVLTANSITVGMEALSDSSPTFVSQHQFSLDNVTFTPTLSISTLAPGDITGIIYVKQTLSSTASLSLWTQRIYADAGAWV
jgi:hypothetical protein